MTTVLWSRLDGPGLERCSLEQTPDGFRLGGTALVTDGGDAYEIRYSVLTDGQWRARTVGAHVQGPSGDRRLALHGDGFGGWSVADNPILDLYGAIDIDLGWTPSTNTLPIRRRNVGVGESFDISVAHVAFPGHAVTRRSQRYTRTAEHEYRFESDDFGATITVDGDGLVTSYEGVWESVG